VPKKKSPFPEKPWHPDPARWNAHLVHPVEIPPVPEPPKKEWEEPKRGWMLYRWDTLEDVKQKL
jgi:hypothetical protein